MMHGGQRRVWLQRCAAGAQRLALVGLPTSNALAATAVKRTYARAWLGATALEWGRQVRHRHTASTSIDQRWGWLKDPGHQKLQQLLQMEAGYFAHVLRQPMFRTVERQLYREFRQRVLREDFSVPECMGSYEYYMRQEPGENYPVYYRRHEKTHMEEVVLNQNVEPMFQHEFHFVTAMKISPDEQHMLCIVENEHEECSACVRDIRSGKLRQLTHLDRIRNVEWANVPGKQVFYFTKVDHNRRPFAVFRCDLQTGDIKQMYEEPNEAFFVDISQTKDGQYILVNSNSKTTSEIRAMKASDASAQPRLLRRRETDTAYFADHANDAFYIVTNADQAENYKIMRTTDTEGSSAWETLIAESPDVKIEDVDLFQKYLVLYERKAGIPRIRVCNLSCPDQLQHIVPLPSDYEICRITPGVNKRFESTRVRFLISTPLVPEIVYDYDMDQGCLHVLKESAVDGHVSRSTKKSRKDNEASTVFKPERFQCYRVHATSSDGVAVPLTLIHGRDLKRNGQNPALVLGYGAYGTNLEADFELEHLSLIERGWVIALAHIRGGGELGLNWYRDGKCLKKKNTFNDFLACSRYLLDESYTNSSIMAAKGVSAGGLVMGYVANEHPELFRAMIMKVPFVDIFQTMQDPALPLTVHEYEEWGDPRDQTVADYIKSYAPCENVRASQAYPAMFVTGSMNDNRVKFWEPLKWVYQLRKNQAKFASKKEKRTIMLKMSDDDGHFGGAGRLEQMQETAMEFAFLYQALKLPFLRD